MKLIQIFGREAPGLDLEACARNNILVRPLERHANRLVTEHVVMLMLALTRGLDDSRAALQRPSSLQPSGWAYNWPACTGVEGLAGRGIGPDEFDGFFRKETDRLGKLVSTLGLKNE